MNDQAYEVSITILVKLHPMLISHILATGRAYNICRFSFPYRRAIAVPITLSVGSAQVW